MRVAYCQGPGTGSKRALVASVPTSSSRLPRGRPYEGRDESRHFAIAPTSPVSTSRGHYENSFFYLDHFQTEKPGVWVAFERRWILSPLASFGRHSEGRTDTAGEPALGVGGGAFPGFFSGVVDLFFSGADR